MGINNFIDKKEGNKKKENKKNDVQLYFFRHDEKRKGTTKPGIRIGDKQVRLTTVGRKNSQKEGKKQNINYNNSIGYYSPRERTKETLYHWLNFPNITENNSLEDIDTLIKVNLKIGNKAKINKKLDFYLGEDMDTKEIKNYNKIAYKHYIDQKDYLLFVLEESDKLGLQAKDKRISSYSKTAGDIAEIIIKYIKVAKNWRQINSKKYFTNELQRLFATHAGVSELFLMKVIEKTKGKKFLKKFLQENNILNGFNYSEGFKIIISENRITLIYNEYIFEITSQIIEKIIKERNYFLEKIKEKS